MSSDTLAISLSTALAITAVLFCLLNELTLSTTDSLFSLRLLPFNVENLANLAASAPVIPIAWAISEAS